MLFRMQHVILVFLCFALAMPSFAELTVRKDGAGDYTSIGAALAAASAGETIRVTDQGEYNEAFDLIDVSLISDPAGARINGDPDALAGRNELIRIGHTQQIVIEGFVIQSARHGIHVWAASTIDLTIRGCEIIAPWAGIVFANDNTTDATCGEVTLDNTYMHDSDYNIMTGGGGSAQGKLNIINGSRIFGSWNGCIRISDPMILTLDGVEIGGSGAGIGLKFDGALGTDMVNVTVSDTNIHGNAKSGILIEAGSGTFTFTNCEITDNAEWGFNSWMGSNEQPRSITLTDSLFTGNGYECVAINGGNTDTSKLQYDIERCRFHCASGAAGALLLNLSNGDFINNLVDHGTGKLISFNQGQKNFYFNTFVSTADSDALRGIQITGDATVDVKNNIFAGVGVAIANDSGTATLTNDHNLFDPRVVMPVNNGSVGEGSLLAAEPGFIEASSGVGTGNFSLADGSPALGVGVEIAGVTVDIDQGARPNPTGSLPDLGAYESLMSPVEISTFSID